MKISNETDKVIEAPSVDFSLQLSLLADEEVENSIFNTLKQLASDVVNKKCTGIGAIVVLGDFTPFHMVEGLVQMKPKQNPIKSLITIDKKEGLDTIRIFSSYPYDGAIIVNKTGQIIGAGLYLVVDHPEIEIPDDCGTRHKAAASFSLRDDIISVLTLSEETNSVRIWRDGELDAEMKETSF